VTGWPAGTTGRGRFAALVLQTTRRFLRDDRGFCHLAPFALVSSACEASVLGGVFICYRREDSGGFAGRIYDRLTSSLGRENVFFDVDSIAPGLDFVDALSERVGRCDALIAVIGKTWLSSADADKKRRLDDPNDFVRIEIEAALSRSVRVIPVLVDGAILPRREDLPPSIDKLTRRQGIEISHARFDSDVENLIRALSELEDEVRNRAPAGADSASHETIAKLPDGETIPAKTPGAIASAIPSPTAGGESIHGLLVSTPSSVSTPWRVALPIAGAIVVAAVIAPLLYAKFDSGPVAHPWKPSFDCRLATFKVETMICNNETLSALDNELATMYNVVRKSMTGDDQKKLDNDESIWVVKRNACSDFDCTKQMFDERISELQTIMKSKP
jgi:uncharacterized protein YecT (DUF1311 family)